MKTKSGIKDKSFIGVWDYSHETGQVHWSDAFFDFIERDRKLGTINIAEDTLPLYSKDEWESMIKNTEKMFFTGIAWKGYFKAKTFKTKTIKFHYSTFYPSFDKEGNVNSFHGELFECSENEYLKHQGENSITEYSLDPEILDLDISCFEGINSEGVLDNAPCNWDNRMKVLFDFTYNEQDSWWQMLNGAETKAAIMDYKHFANAENSNEIAHFQYRTKNLSIVLSVTYINQKNKLQGVFRFRGFSNILMEDYRFLSDNMLNEIPASICIMDLKHRYQVINKGTVKDKETRKWLAGKTDFDYCRKYKKDISLAIRRRNRFNQTLINEKSSFFEEYFPDENGGVYHLRTYNLIKDNNGLPLFVLGYGFEITELRRHEETLTKLNLAIEAATDGIALLNSEDKFYYMNEAFARIFKGKNPSEYIGKTFSEIYDKDEIKRMQEKVLPIVRQKGFWTGEATGLTQDNQHINLELSFTALSDRGLICICRDNTVGKIQEMEMRKLAVIAEETHSSIMIANSEGKIEWVNPAFEVLTGYTKDEILTRDTTFLQGKNSNKSIVASMRSAVEKGEIFNGEVLCYKKDGRNIWIHMNITPVFESNGNLDKFIGILNDITLLKEAEININKAMLREKELSNLKTKFVSLASHEFRTPLAGIQSSVDLASLFLSKDRPDSIEKVRHYLSRIQSQIDRLTFILNDVLQLGKINMGKVSFSPTKGNLDEFIQDQIERLEKENLLDGRKVVFKKYGIRKDLEFDGVLLAHILQNLISNAIKYSEKKPDPEIHLHYKKDQIKIEVVDFGMGIPKKEITQLFETFFRGTNTENIQGTGLGLVVVKQFIDVHHGKIQVKSELNKGSKFIVTLPIKY